MPEKSARGGGRRAREEVEAAEAREAEVAEVEDAEGGEEVEKMGEERGRGGDSVRGGWVRREEEMEGERG